MDIKGPYILNGKYFGQEEFISFLNESISGDKLEDWQLEIYHFILDFFNEKKLLIQKTSGTTGDPKSIELDRDAMIRSAKMTIEYFQLNPGDKILLCLPVRYIAGKMMVLRAIVGGMDLITMEPTGNPLEKMDSSIHFAAMVPLQLFEALKNPEKIEKIDKLLIGGGEINPGLLEGIKKLSHTKVYESFAMSESYTHFAIRQLNGSSPQKYFKVLKGVKITSDERSCLLVDVPGVTKGIVVTNDIVEIVNENEFQWLGRIDNIIKTGGIKIIPEILEKKISEIFGLEVLIIGIPDKKLGQKLILLVETEEDSFHERIRMEELQKTLAKHELPKEIRNLPEFPRNNSMKVDRRKIQSMLK